MKCSKCKREISFINPVKEVSYYTCDLCFKTEDISPIVNLFNNKLSCEELFELDHVEMLSLDDYFVPPKYSNITEDLPEPPTPPFQDISTEESISSSDDEDTYYSSIKSLGTVSYIYKNKMHIGHIDRKTGSSIYYKGMLFLSTNEWVNFISIENI